MSVLGDLSLAIYIVFWLLVLLGVACLFPFFRAKALRHAITVLIGLAKSCLLVLLLPSWIAVWIMGHQVMKGIEEFSQTAEKFQTAIPDSITPPYTVEDLNIELVRQIGQEVGQELGLDLEETLEHLQEPDGGLWLYVAQGEVIVAMASRLGKRHINWLWITIVMQAVLVAVGYFGNRKLKVPKFGEAQWGKVQQTIWMLVRRYFPLLMILLSAITVGIKIHVTRRIMLQSAFSHSIDVAANDCTRIVAGARQWYRKPADEGGGGGSWDGLSFDVLPVGSSTPDGSYAFTVNEEMLTVTGTGLIQNSKGEVAHVTSTYNAATDSLVTDVER